MDSAATVGTATKYAREDHIHPSDASRAPLASPPLSGTPTAPTPPVLDNSLKIATTQYVDRTTREKTGNRTYYVRKDGNDGNNGLADNAGGAFLTIQRGISAACAIDMGVNSVTVQVRAGTYNENVAGGSYLGVGPITLLGDITTPSNVVINGPNFDFYLNNSGYYILRGFKLTGAVGLRLFNSCYLEFGDLEFGTCTNYHIYLNGGATASCQYPCHQGQRQRLYHILLQLGCMLDMRSANYTFTTNPTSWPGEGPS